MSTVSDSPDLDPPDSGLPGSDLPDSDLPDSDPSDGATEAPPTDELGAAAIRPGLVALCFAYRLVFAALLAVPISLAVGALVGAHPRGDAVLFEPGGVWLAEAARLLRPLLASFVGYGGGLALLATIGWLLPLAALIASLGGDCRERPLEALLGRAGRCWGRLVLLLGAVRVAQVILVALVASLARYALAAAFQDAQTFDLLRLAGLLLGLAGAWLLGLVHDVIRCRVVQEDLGLYDALEHSWEQLRATGLVMIGAAAWRALLGGAALAAAVLVTIVQPSGVVAVLLAGQLAALAHVILRASWFAYLSRRRRVPTPA